MDRGSLGRVIARHQHLLAAGVLVVLLAVFFSPLALDDATFSTVEASQANTYPWAGPKSRPRPTRPSTATPARSSSTTP